MKARINDGGFFFFFFFFLVFVLGFQALLEMKASLGVGAVQQRIYLSLQPVSERSGCRGNAAAQKPRAASSILPTCLPPSLSKKIKNKKIKKNNIKCAHRYCKAI